MGHAQFLLEGLQALQGGGDFLGSDVYAAELEQIVGGISDCLLLSLVALSEGGDVVEVLQRRSNVLIFAVSLEETLDASLDCTEVGVFDVLLNSPQHFVHFLFLVDSHHVLGRRFVLFQELVSPVHHPMQRQQTHLVIGPVLYLPVGAQLGESFLFPPSGHPQGLVL